jgi:hypothetical protein
VAGGALAAASLSGLSWLMRYQVKSMTSVCEAILAKQQGVGRVVNDAKPEKLRTESFFVQKD